MRSGERSRWCCSSSATRFSRCWAPSSVSMPMLLTARLLLGLTIGVSVVVVPVYVAESAPAAVRGRLLTAYQLATVSGLILGYLAGYLLAGTHSWRWMLGLAAVPATLLLPFLIAHARYRSLVPAEGPGRRRPPGAAAGGARRERRSRSSPRSAAAMSEGPAAACPRCCDGRICGPPLFVITLGFLVQITGINAIIYYSPRLFEAMGFAGNFALLGAAGTGPARRVGGGLRLAGSRRPARPAPNPVVRHRHDDRRRRRAGRRLRPGLGACLRGSAGVLLFIIGFTFGFGSLVWVYAGESFPTRLRSMGSSTMLTSNLVGQRDRRRGLPDDAAFTRAAQGLSRYSGSSRSSPSAVVYRYAPETKGRQLEEIRHFWENGGRWARALEGYGDPMPLICAGTVVTRGQVCRPGWLQTSGRADPGLRVRRATRTRRRSIFPIRVVVPGFIDMHVHGGGGASYTEAHGIAAAAGSTCGTAPPRRWPVWSPPAPAELIAGVRALAEATRQGVVAGIHLEGPWLSPGTLRRTRPYPDARSGPRRDRRRAGRGRRRDPDGHAGARTAGQRLGDPALCRRGSCCRRWTYRCDLRADPSRHRPWARPSAPICSTRCRRCTTASPGPVLALLEDPRVTVELIADGVHVHPAVVRAVIEAAGPDRVALVTDAFAAAGCGDGRFRLGTVADRRRVAAWRGCAERRRSPAAPRPWISCFAPWPGSATRMRRWPPRCR